MNIIIETATIDKAEYIRRCAAVYKKCVKDIADELALQFAEACWENRDLDDDINPERDAIDDLSYWDDDGE